MDTLILIGALALLLAMFSTGAPAPQPPTVVIMQSPPTAPQSGGCLGLILAIVLFAMLAALVAQVAQIAV